MEERQRRGGRKLALLGALGLGLAMIGRRRRRRLGGMLYSPPFRGYGRGFGYGPGFGAHGRCGHRAKRGHGAEAEFTAPVTAPPTTV